MLIEPDLPSVNTPSHTNLQSPQRPPAVRSSWLPSIYHYWPSVPLLTLSTQGQRNNWVIWDKQTVS